MLESLAFQRPRRVGALTQIKASTGAVWPTDSVHAMRPSTVLRKKPIPSASRLRRQVPAILAVAFALEIALSGWKPWHLQDWAMENLLTLATGWWLLRHHRQHPFSNLSYLLLFVFGSTHVLGSHYTYSSMPYDDWARSLFHISLNELIGATRNHYDRFVHFLFGLCCYLPVRELLRSRVTARGAGSHLLPTAVIVMIATFYELAEWLAMEGFGGDLGASFLGMQGDIWDAQKDVLAAVIGVVLAVPMTAWIRRERVGAPKAEQIPEHSDRVVYLTRISRNAKRGSAG